MTTQIDPMHYRQVLGQYPTGVAVITALSADGEPLGMTVGSFTSVSLSPPLVAFLPDRSSSSWAALRASGNKFCVNMLSADQEATCRAIAVRKTDKFADINWRLSPQGNPVIDGAVAWVDCAVDSIHEAGDHHIVIGAIVDLGVEHSGYPLLFFRGGYGSFAPASMAAGDADLVDQLRMVDLARSDLERLASRFATEVTVVSLVRDQLVLTASTGQTTFTETPTRVGRRTPFVPPLGSVFAAWGTGAVRERWLANLDEETHEGERLEFAEIPERVLRRGYSISFGHQASQRLEVIYTRFSDGDAQVTLQDLRAAIRAVAPFTNPATYDRNDLHELHAITAPVFRPDHTPAFEVTLWGPSGRVPASVIDEYAAALMATTRAASQAIRADVLE